MKAQVLLVVVAACSAFAQGTFQNLDFEQPTLLLIPGDPYGSVQFAPAFPGWTGIVGGISQSNALYNNLFLDSSGIAILDHGFRYAVILEGNFTAVLQAGPGLGSQPADTTLWQTGLIPVGSQSLRFIAYDDYFRGTFSVSMGGQTLALIPLSAGTNYTLYGADISAWAGKAAQLSFTAFAGPPHVTGENALYLDSIDFSDVAIPEPSVLTLAALGTLFLTWRLRHRIRLP